MDNMESNTKRVKIVVEAEITDSQEGTTEYRIINGFGDPVIRFADETVTRP